MSLSHSSHSGQSGHSAKPTHPGLLAVSRLLAAVFGGYALASALAAFLAAALPGARVDAVLAGMQWSFALHALAVIWAFSPGSAGRGWLGVLGASGPIGRAPPLPGAQCGEVRKRPRLTPSPLLTPF